MNEHNGDEIDLVVYARNSDDSQTFSQSVQANVFLIACETLIPQLLGKRGKIVGTYKDEGTSASKPKSKRSEFKRLCDDIESGVVKALMVVNTSRITRLHPIDAIAFYGIVRQYHVTLISIDDAKIFNPDGFGDLIQLVCKAQENHEYSRTIAKNSLRGRMASVSRGNANVRTIPYGMAKLVVDDAGVEHRYPRTVNFAKPKSWTSHIEPGDPIEQSVVTSIFTMFLKEDISYSAIATRLNADSNPAISRGVTGDGWVSQTVSRMLSNKHYNGMVFIGDNCDGVHYRMGDNGDIVESKSHTTSKTIVVRTKHPPLIPSELFDAVQLKIRNKESDNLKPQSQNEREGFALTGSLVCGNCGHGMFAGRNKGNLHYHCNTATKNRSKGCGH